MDSLFWKMGTLKAMVGTKAGRHSEGSDASLSQPRSVQVCVCRSPPSQAKPSSASSNNAPPAQEISNGAPAPPFNPLPLPSSRTTVPAPLKFLWFNRKNNRAAVENKGSESGLPLPPSLEESSGEKSVANDPSERSQSAWNDGALQGNRCKDEELDISTDVNAQLSAAILSEAVMANVDSSKPFLARKSWISRITDLKALWPNPKTSKKPSISLEETATSPNNTQDATMSTPAIEVDGSCVGCECASDVCSLEVPYAKVLHSKESFSKFLQDASLYDMKDLARMSFLCDMAYTIPDIQPGQLLKYHHLKFVTSSLEKKAEAEANVKEGDSSKKPCKSEKETLALNGDTSGVSAREGGTSAVSSIESDAQEEVVSVHAINDSQSNAAGSGNIGAGCTVDPVEESEASISFSNEGETGSQILNHEDKNGPSDEESLMAVAPVTAVVLAEEETKVAVAKDLQSASSCPSEWFICDDLSMHTRFLVIQGSGSLASWQANLFFEPTKFEELDILVHRGIYEAANALYEQMLPEVLAHFWAHGDLAQVRLTGHSLGGSLATLLALMFQIRGALPRKAILPVVTFGSPCIMCGGDKLLQKLGIPGNHIQSVIMHRDVVPRAFSCDYPDRVAQVLKRLNGKFRDHPCLNNQKLLYAPMGQLLILQPEENVAPSHPLLPCGNGLYLLRHPIHEDGVENAMELRAAQRAFLNIPHPLEILSDPGAYGLNGAISRDHNPRSYIKAIHVVLWHEVKRLRRVQREQRRQLWWPLVIAESSIFAQRGLNISSDQMNTSGALTPAFCKTSIFFKQPLRYSSTTSRISFAFGGLSFWETQKGAFSRYTRLIASKHVHLGIALIISVRVIIVECLSTFYIWI